MKVPKGEYYALVHLTVSRSSGPSEGFLSRDDILQEKTILSTLHGILYAVDGIKMAHGKMHSEYLSYHIAMQHS